MYNSWNVSTTGCFLKSTWPGCTMTVLCLEMWKMHKIHILPDLTTHLIWQHQKLSKPLLHVRCWKLEEHCYEACFQSSFYEQASPMVMFGSNYESNFMYTVSEHHLLLPFDSTAEVYFTVSGVLNTDGETSGPSDSFNFQFPERNKSEVSLTSLSGKKAEFNQRLCSLFNNWQEN